MGLKDSARVLQVQIAAGTRQPMTVLTEIAFAEGHGIEGDHHAGKVTSERQVLLMDAETQKALGIEPAVTRENVTTTGLDMNSLKQGHRVRLGESALIEVTGDCPPCGRMDEAKPGLRADIKGRRGVLGKIIANGTVKPGDKISLE